MSFQEKRSITYIFTFIIVYAFYYFFVIGSPETWGLADIDNVYTRWGIIFATLLPVQIIVSIPIHIIFHIVNKIATNEDEPGFVDEFDKMIELKTSRISLMVFFFGFYISMIALAFGMDSNSMFFMLFITMLMTGLTVESAQIYYYRRGV